MTNIVITRNTNFDFLKFIGISCIILAHMGVPGIVFQARNFDVPLMVLLSGISFSQFSSKNYSSYKNYVFSRFIRLVIPTWLFLIFYNYINFLGSNEPPSLYSLTMQFALIGGTDIGIWIIRIFFSMAIIAPLLLNINHKINSNTQFYIILFAVYIIYEVALYNSKQLLPKNIFTICNIIIFFTISYGMIFLYGIRILSFSKTLTSNNILILGVIFLSCLLFLYFKNNKFIPTQQFKYPPQLYYLSYSVLVSVILFHITKYHKIFIGEFVLFQFIGRSTLWIYLWHWFFIKTYSYCQIDLNFLLKYFLIYFVTVIWVYIQTKIIHLIALNMLSHKKQKLLLIKVFTG